MFKNINDIIKKNNILNSIMKNTNVLNNINNIIKTFSDLNLIISFLNNKGNNIYASLNSFFTSDYISFYIFKYDPFYNNVPWIQSWVLHRSDISPMLLDNLFILKNNNDESLSFRRSCRDGICGSCAMNVNGINTLVCTKNIMKESKNKYYVFPLPHMPIVKDLVVSMDHFYNQYKSIDPFLKTRSFLSLELSYFFGEYFNSVDIEIYDFKSENIQKKNERILLDGLYECILCASCSTSCPSYWWNQDKYLGPAVLLQAYRWIIDTRDDDMLNRLYHLDDKYKLYRCHTILNCVQTCPKKLSPAKAIDSIKSLVGYLNMNREGFNSDLILLQEELHRIY